MNGAVDLYESTACDVYALHGVLDIDVMNNEPDIRDAYDMYGVCIVYGEDDVYAHFVHGVHDFKDVYDVHNVCAHDELPFRTKVHML